MEIKWGVQIKAFLKTYVTYGYNGSHAVNLHVCVTELFSLAHIMKHLSYTCELGCYVLYNLYNK